MKQARRWLLFTAALALLPQGAYAQKKKPPKGGEAPAGAPAANAPVNMDEESKPASPATPPAGGESTTPAPGEGGATGPAAGGMDICQVTPDAPSCQAQKEINIQAEAKKTVRAEVY